MLVCQKQLPAPLARNDGRLQPQLPPPLTHRTTHRAATYQLSRRAMGEVVNVLVAFAVIVFIVRWATSGTQSSRVFSYLLAHSYSPPPSFTSQRQGFLPISAFSRIHSWFQTKECHPGYGTLLIIRRTNRSPFIHFHPQPSGRHHPQHVPGHPYVRLRPRSSVTATCLIAFMSLVCLQ